MSTPILREARTALMLAVRLLHWGHAVGDLRHHISNLDHLATDLAAWVAIISTFYAVIEGCIRAYRWLNETPTPPSPPTA
jgi:hypothetical protein